MVQTASNTPPDPTKHHRLRWDDAARLYAELSDEIAFYDAAARDLVALLDTQSRVVMDFGCGSGRLSRHVLAARPGQIARLVMVDGAATMLDMTRDITGPATIERFVGDERLAGLPEDLSGSLDAILANAVIGNLRDEALRPDLGPFLSAAAGMLRPGGTIIANVSDHEFDFGDAQGSAFHAWADALWPSFEAVTDWSPWTAQAIHDAAGRAGFTVDVVPRSYDVSWSDFVTFYSIPFMGRSRFPEEYSERIAMLDRQPPAFETISFRWCTLVFTALPGGHLYER